jgi:hypothetical protein
MIRDLGQRRFEKIEATVQISYGVSLAHCFDHFWPGCCTHLYAAEAG